MNDDDFLVRRDDIDAFVHDVLLDPGRRMPVVAITTPWSRRAWLSATDLQDDLGVDVRVCLLETGDTTWRLTELLPDRLDVYGGALRIWWPGLAEDSEPLDHPLIFISSQGMAEAARQQVLELFEGERPSIPPTRPPSGDRAHEPRAVERRPPPSTPVPATKSETAPDKHIETATVESIEGKRILIRVGGERGVIGYADIKLEALGQRLRPAQDIQVFRTQATRQGMSVWSIQGLLDAPPPRAAIGHATDPWQVIAAEYRVGDVVHAHILHIERYFVLVELLPDAKAIVHVSELAYEWTEDPSALFEVGEPVQVKILVLDPSAARCEASIKRAYGQEPRLPLALAPPPGLAPVPTVTTASPTSSGSSLRRMERRLETAEHERLGLSEDRKQAIKQARDQADQNIALRKQVKSLEDRNEALGKKLAAMDPLASETSFLRAIRVEYAQQFDEGDRFRYPLQRMLIGREFLERVRALDGIDRDKIVEVCAQVASGRAHEIPARQVHELRTGEGGTPTRIRAADDARAWRCSLQVNTASARRLHWWSIPGSDGPTIELASVAVHDELGIPE